GGSAIALCQRQARQAIVHHGKRRPPGGVLLQLLVSTRLRQQALQPGPTFRHLRIVTSRGGEVGRPRVLRKRLRSCGPKKRQTRKSTTSRPAITQPARSMSFWIVSNSAPAT